MAKLSGYKQCVKWVKESSGFRKMSQWTHASSVEFNDGTTLQNKISSMESNASNHTHDDRYYTESEVNSKLSVKSDTSHTHDDRYYTESEVNSKLSVKSDTSHTHDERYYTESEIDSKFQSVFSFDSSTGTLKISI